MLILVLLYALDLPIEYELRAYLKRHALNHGRRK